MEIRPLSDWIVLKRSEYKHPVLYVHGAETCRGTVVAAGPGKRLRKWVQVQDPINGKWFKVRAGAETGKIQYTCLKPGDVVEYSNYGWEEREVNGEKYIFVREGSVIAYADTSDTRGMEGHNSAVLP